MAAHRPALLGITVTALIGALLWTFAADPESAKQDRTRPKLGLMTSLPIYWSESAGLHGMLADDQPVHWVRARLEEDFELIPLNALAATDSTEPNTTLNRLQSLILAQPRALPPADMVALDAWVREGGQLLLFADPMLTEHSEFGFGDQRRPQDIALLSPILSRWGLRQTYDESQDMAAQAVMLGDVPVPVRKTGRFELSPNDMAECTLLAEAVIAACEIGEGRAVIVSDAALLEHEGNPEVSGKALAELVGRAIAPAPKNLRAD